MTDLAAIGSAEAILRQFQRYYDAGATDLVLNSLDPSTSAEVWQISAMLRKRN